MTDNNLDKPAISVDLKKYRIRIHKNTLHAIGDLRAKSPAVFVPYLAWSIFIRNLDSMCWTVPCAFVSEHGKAIMTPFALTC